MLCVSCGKTLPESSAFCAYCGASQQTFPPYVSKKQKGKRSLRWVAILCVVAVLGVGIGVFITTKGAASISPVTQESPGANEASDVYADETFDLIEFALRLGFERNNVMEALNTSRGYTSLSFRYFYPTNTEDEPDFVDVELARDGGYYSFNVLYAWGYMGIIQEYAHVTNEEDLPPGVLDRIKNDAPVEGQDGMILYGGRLDDDIQDIKIVDSELYLSAEELNMCMTVMERVAQTRQHDDPRAGFEDDFY